MRILEFDSSITLSNNRQSKADIELWDCSGDSKFQTTWPALAWELHGVIFLFNPEDETQAKDLDFYYEHFVKKPGLQDSNCLVLAFPHEDGTAKYGSSKLCKYH